MSSTFQECYCQIRWRLYSEEEQWEVTDKTVFTKLNRRLAGFHSLLGYLSPGNQGWSAVSPTRISNKVVTTSECNNMLWNLTRGGNEKHSFHFYETFKKYVVGGALVSMHLAAVEYFCPMTFFQHSDFWLQVGLWMQHDSSAKSFYCNPNRNAEIGRRSLCFAA